MILTGAARTIGIKAFFQLGFDDPFLTALLMLFAHTLAIPLYYLLTYYDTSKNGSKESSKTRSNLNRGDTDPESSTEESEPNDLPIAGPDTFTRASSDQSTETLSYRIAVPFYYEIFYPQDRPRNGAAAHARDLEATRTKAVTATSSLTTQHVQPHNKDERIVEPAFRDEESSVPDISQPEADSASSRKVAFHLSDPESNIECPPTSRQSPSSTRSLPYAHNEINPPANGQTSCDKSVCVNSVKGSVSGITDESRRAVQWIHKIPNCVKPIISSFFNMLDVGFRMLAVLHLAASIMELTASGLELLFSLLAARFIRKREIYTSRWFGASLVLSGLVLVAGSDFANNDSSSLALGMLFVVLKTLSACLKDMSQELFMHESRYPAALLLGFEGLYGLILAVVLLFGIGPLFGYVPRIGDLFRTTESTTSTLILILVLFLGGLYSILGTAVTSSMTRNMWKNFRGLVVWIVGLAIYYSHEGFGEPFLIPGSFMLLNGFIVMLIGLYAYYYTEQDQQQ